MQERAANTVNMDNDTETEDISAPQASRGRNNSKLANKLVRSHAMREEASPPRDVLIAAAAAAAASAQHPDDASTPTTPRRTSSTTPNTLSPPIQHRIRSPPDFGAGTTVASARGSSNGGGGGGNGGNPVLVLSPSVSPSDLHQITNTSSPTSSTHTIQCSYHHQQQQQQCNHQHNYHSPSGTTMCNVQSRVSPTNNNSGGTSPTLSTTSTAHRCCSPQQQQMLLTVDYVSSDVSGDDRGNGMVMPGDGTSHKVAKLNRQNLDLCTNKPRNPATTIREESSQQSTKAPKCDCNMNNNYQSSQMTECSSSISSSSVVQRDLSHYSNGGGGGSGGGGGVHGNHNNQLTVNRPGGGNRAKLRQQSSSQSYGSFDGSHSSLSLSASPCLSRDNSSEQYTDTTGVDLDTFIPETLNRNAKDRALMLRIEEELVSLAKDQTRTHYKFPPMSSYQRMLVHRCAAYFGMDHNIESSGKCVVVNRTKATRIPSIPFKEHLRTDTCMPASNYSNNGSATGSTTSLINNIDSDQQHQQHQSNMRRSILKRGDNSGGSMDEITSGSGRGRDMMMLLSAGNGGDKRSKSFEEREEEYAKVRRRIFNPMIDHEHRGGSQDEFRWSDVHWPSTDSDVSTRNKLHPMEHHHAHRCRPLGRLQKVQSEEKGEDTLRPCVAKSYSFGGYGGCFTRGDSIMSTHSASPRLLTKQDSSSSSTYHHAHHHHHHRQLSPSSSGYKTQSSQRSTESVTPSPTSTPYLPTNTTTSHRQDSTNTNVSSVSSSNSCDQNNALLDIGCGGAGGQQMVFWAVTDVDSVPRGSVIINPATGMAVRNDDGSVYRYDPGNLPAGMGGCGGGKGGGEGVGQMVGGGGGGGGLAVEKHTNYVETKILPPEPLMEEPPLCSNEMVPLVQEHSPKRQQPHVGKAPLSPSHYHQHHHHDMDQQPQDEQVSYQEQNDMVELVECQQGAELSQMLHSPSHDSPQRRRKTSPFKKQENFAQACMDKPIMVSTYTSTSSPSLLPYSPPPPQLPTPRPSRPSSVLSQHQPHTPSIQHAQQVPRYTQQQPTTYQQHQQQHLMMQVSEQQQQQQQAAYLMGQPPVYSEAVMYGHGAGPGQGGGGGGLQPAQPCFVYGYGMPGAAGGGFNPAAVMENGLPDVGVNMNMGVGGYYLADGAGAAPTITYQPWAPNQPATISYFAAPGPSTGAQGVGPPPPPQGAATRFSVPMHAQAGSYLAPSAYAPHHPTATNYITCPAAAAAAAAQLANAAAVHQPPTELIPLYSPGQPHILYAPHPSVAGQPPTVGPPVTGQLYPTALYGGGNVPYTPPPQQVGPPLLAMPQQHQQQPPPQQHQYYSTSTASSTPTGAHHHHVMSAFTYPTGAPTPPTPIPMMGVGGQGPGAFGQGIVHGIGQMSLAGGAGKGRSTNPSHYLDRRNSMQRMGPRIPTPGASSSSSAGRMSFHQPPQGGACSSQSSTEPSSPAITVVPPYHRLPPTSGTDTPPIPAHVMMAAPQQHFLPIQHHQQQQQQQQQSCSSSNMVMRPINTVHSSPPITTMSRSSRSPTPAGSDISLVGERPKFPTLPATFAGVYHPAAMPFMFPADVRFGMRSQSSPFRQMSPHQRPVQQALGTDRIVRNRKPRGNKQYLPPNGRPNM